MAWDDFRLLSDPAPQPDEFGDDEFADDPVIRQLDIALGRRPPPGQQSSDPGSLIQTEQQQPAQAREGYFSSLADVGPVDMAKDFAAGVVQTFRPLFEGQGALDAAPIDNLPGGPLIAMARRGLRDANPEEFQRAISGQAILDTQSPEYQQQAAKRFVERDPSKPWYDPSSYSAGDATAATVVSTVAKSAPSILGGIGTGVGATKALQQLAQPLTKRAVAGKILEGNAAGAEKRLKAINATLAAIGYGLGEGGIAAAQAKQDIRDQILSLDMGTLSRSSRFQEIWLAAQELPDAERFAYARDTLATELSNTASAQTLIATFATGPLGSKLVGRIAGRGMGEAADVATGSLIKTTLKEAGGEAGQEFLQSGAEAAIGTTALNRAGMNLDVAGETANQAVGGALAGGALGGGVSAFTQEGPRQPPRAAPVGTPPPSAAGSTGSAPAAPESTSQPPQTTSSPQERVSGKDLMGLIETAKQAGVPATELTPIAQALLRAGKGKKGDAIRQEAATTLRQKIEALRAPAAETDAAAAPSTVSPGPSESVAPAQESAPQPTQTPTAEPAAAADQDTEGDSQPADPTVIAQNEEDDRKALDRYFERSIAERGAASFKDLRSEIADGTTFQLDIPGAKKGVISVGNRTRFDLRKEWARFNSQRPASPSEIPKVGIGTVSAGQNQPAAANPGGRLLESVKADPEGALQAYAKVAGTDGGRVLAPDLAKQISPEYNADRTLSDSMGPGAGWLMQEAFNRKLKEAPAEGQDNLVVFTSGGTGAGKSTAVEVDPDIARAQIVYDTNLAKFDVAKRRIEAALAAGKKVVITHVYRDPVEAYENGVLPRARSDAEGRPVTFDNHAKMHAQSNAVVREIALAYADNEDVEVRVIDNSGGPGSARIIPVADLPRVEYTAARDGAKAALESQYDAGSVDDRIYRASGGERTERTPKAEPQDVGTGDRGQSKQGRAGEAESPAEVASAQRSQARDPKKFLGSGEYEEVVSLTLPNKRHPNTAIADAEIRVVKAQDGTFAVGYGFQIGNSGEGRPPAGVYQTTDEAMEAGKRAILDGIAKSDASAQDRARIENWVNRRSSEAPAKKPDKAKIIPTRAPNGGVQISVEPVAPQPSANTVFTDDAAAAARERLRKKLGTARSGVDPEMLQDGITLAGYHIEKGARTFAAFAKAMISDLGEAVRPYLKSWYMGVKYDPRAANFEGMDDASTVDKVDVATVDAAVPVDAPTAGLTQGEQEFVRAVLNRLPPGNLDKPLRGIVEARALYKQTVGGELSGAAIKRVDELIELAVVQKARLIVSTLDGDAAYDSLVRMYEGQPRLGTRTSTSIENQAYSTPAPLAFIASRLAGITSSTMVYEPSAGNGMLLLQANPKNTHAVELNENRASALRTLGFTPVVGDTMDPKTDPDHKQDVVIANPPFGVVKTDAGNSRMFYVDLSGGVGPFQTTEIDHAISLRALEQLKPDGRAVLIIGGVNKQAKSTEARSDAYNGAAKRKFFYRLYNQYNVTDHFTVAGELYERQGAGWPVDVIVIEGRGKSPRALPAVDVPRVYDSWAALKPLLEAKRGTPTGSLESAVTEPAAAPDGGSNAPADSDRPADVPVAADNANPVADRPVAGPEAGSPVATGQPVSGRPAGGRRGNSGRRGSQPPAGEQPVGVGAPSGPEPAAADGRGDDATGVIGSARADQPGQDRPADTPAGVGERARPAPVAAEGQTQVEYIPASKSGAIGTLVPTNMGTAIAEALRTLESRVGPIDQFVATELGYEVSSIGEYFSAEQLDSLALAISQMKGDAGFVIGDQTGIGKGRVVAGVIRYALRNGRFPIFVTEKPNLYGDMYRDLTDIGMKDVRPIMTNSGEKVPLDDAGNVVLKSGTAAKHNALLAQLANEITLGDHNVVFTTYNQMQTLKGQLTARMTFLQALAPNAIIILDESHNAGGNDSERKNRSQKAMDGDTTKTGRAAFVRGLIGQARGVFYSSATWAKRPSVMDLYFKTDMAKAVEGDVKKLPGAIAAGGVPLQQVVSTMLARSGQYIRRERSFAGVEYNTLPVPVDRNAAEQISLVMLRVKQFDDVKKGAIKAIKDEVKAEAGAVSESGAVGKAGVESTNFTSVMHNVIDQMLVALKVDAAADRAIARLKDGEKVVITVANTMGSFIEEYVESADLKAGDAIGLSFADLLRRYLEKSRTITIKSQNGPPRRHYLKDEELGPIGLYAYREVVRAIESATGLNGVPVSPIDWMHFRLAEAGYKSAEITGRTSGVDYGKRAGETPRYRIRSSKETSIAGRRKTISGFNGGEIDVIILNQAGSTGLSLHASSKFKDQRRRRMILAQAEKNIDTHMQMLSRVHRTGQVIAPAYDQLIADIPAEKRPAAAIAKKMASLNASTTAARTSQFTATDVVDFLNQYGDEVVAQLMEDLPDTHRELGEPLDDSDSGGFSREDAARKVSGRIPLLPVAKQEELYALIEAGYQEAIQRAEAMGENALEAKTLPLEARTVSRSAIFDGQEGSTSPFSQGAMAEVVDVKRLGKPMTSAEVVAAVAERLGQPAESTIDALARAGFSKRQELVQSVTAEFNAYRDQQRSQMEQAGSLEQAIEGRITALNGALQKWQAHMTRMTIGGRYQITLPDGMALYGVLVDLQRKKGVALPVAPGAWTARFAVADGIRTLSLPLSKIALPGASDTGTGRVAIEPANFNALTRAPIMQMFDDGQSVSRERRVIITGNLLAAYSKTGRGQIINYTTDSGAVEQGILMPRNFDLEEFADAQPVEMTPRAALNLLLAESKALVETPDGNLRVQRWGSNFAFITPRSKADGGTYFLNPLLRAVVGDFVSTSSSMRAVVESPEDALRAMEVVTGPMQVRLVANVFKPEARAAGGRSEVKPQPKKDGDALYSRGGTVPAFYSPTLRALESAPQAKAHPAQWLGWLRNQPGVKEEELQWMDLREWLTSQQGAVTREAITEYARAHQIAVTETLLGPPPASQEESMSDEHMQDRRSDLVDQLEEKFGIALDDGISGVSLTETATDEEVEYDDLPPDAQALLDEWQKLGEYLNGDGPDGASITAATRFNNSDLRTPGGSMYRELLLTLPTGDKPGGKAFVFFPDEEAADSFLGDVDAAGFGHLDYGRDSDNPRVVVFERPLSAQLDRIARQNNGDPVGQAVAADKVFHGGHWEEPNVVAHVRFDERTDTDGNRILFIDELQSDWHQKGRKVGYIESTPPGDTTGWTVKTDESNKYTGQRDIRVYNEKGQMVTMRSGFRGTDAEAIASAEESFRNVVNFNRVPDAPFKTTWPELSLKRMIRWAAEHGFDGIAWTPGKVQNQRYDLQMALNSLSWKSTGKDGQGPTVELDTKRGVTITLMTLPGGEIVGAFETTGRGAVRQTPSFEDKRLSDVIGKELADRISEQPSGRLTGAGLEVGGQGMIGFYDKILVDAANKIGKKYKAKVNRGRVDTGKFDADAKERAEAHVMLLTPELREAAAAGLPLFQRARASGSSVAQVREWLAPAIKAVKGAADVKVVADVAALRDATGRPDIPSDVNGVYFVGDREIYLVASALPTKDAAQRKFAHEMFGHLALERHADMQRAIKMVLNLRTMKSRSVTALWNEVARTQPGLSPGNHAKEVIALMAERGVNNSIMDRLLTWARELLRSWGLDVKYSEAELRALIANAGRALREEARAAQADEALIQQAGEAFDRGDFSTLGAALGSMDMANSPLIESGSPVSAFYRRSPVLDAESVDELTEQQVDDAIAAHMIPPAPPEGDALYSRQAPMDDDTRRVMQKVMANAAHSALPIKDRARLWLRKTFDLSGLAMRQYLVNKFAAIAEYERLLNGGELRDASVSAYKQTVATQNLGGVMQAIMQNGIPVWRDGAYVTADDGRKGILEIFAPLVNHPDGNLLPQWELYAAARRASRLISEKNRDGTSREKLFTDEDIATGLRLGDEHPEFKQVFNDWQAFNKQALDMAQEAGLLNAESRALWEVNDYVPFYRAVESVSGKLNPVSLNKAIANQRAKIRTLSGGVQPLEDVFESMLMNTAHLVDTSFKNRAAQAIVTAFDGVATVREPKPTEMLRLSVRRITDALDTAGLMVLPTDLQGDVPVGEPNPGAEYIKYFRKVAPVGKDIVTVMFDGEPQYFRVLDPLLMEAVTQIDPNPSLRKLDLFGLLPGAKRLLTRAVTILPGFIVANFVRDTLSNVVQNQNKTLGDMLKLTFITEAAKGVKDFVKDDPVVTDLMMAGAFSGDVYDNQRGNIKKALTKLMRDEAQSEKYLRTLVSPRRLLHVWTQVQQSAENANRLATYRLVRERGGSHAEAAYQAHDVLNFQQHGSHLAVQWLVMAVPFLNARIQGLDRLARGFAANRMGFAMKGALITAATLAIMALGDDDERYQELEEWDRDVNWHLFFGDSHVRIPKPFEIGLLFATAPERMIRQMRGQDSFRDTGNAIVRAVTDTFAFNPMPQLVKPLLEAKFNYSSFRGGPILSMSDRNVLPESQARPWTSPSLVEIAKAMPDSAPEILRSPLMLEHLVRGYTGGLGMGMLEQADRLTRAAGGYPDAPQQAFHEIALRRFYRDGAPRQTKWQDELYRMMEVADDTARTVKKLADEGRIDDAKALAQERRQVLILRPGLNDLQQQIRRLNAQARVVQSSRAVTPERKRQLLDDIYRRRNELARRVAPYAATF